MRAMCCAVDKVMDLATTMQEKGVSQKCQDAAVENLASCATDDSMAVKQGCCSKDCSTGIKKVGTALNRHHSVPGSVLWLWAYMHHGQPLLGITTPKGMYLPPILPVSFLQHPVWCLLAQALLSAPAACTTTAAALPHCSPSALAASTSTPRPSAMTPAAKA